MNKSHEESKMTLLSRVLRAVSAPCSQWKEELSPRRIGTRPADDEYSGHTLRTLLNATADTALLINLDGTILSLNQTAATQLNDNVENLIGKNIYNYMPLVRADIRKKRTQRLIETKTPMTFDDLSASRNMRYTLYPIVDQHGRVNHIAIYGVDITASHQQQTIEVLMNVFDQHILRGDDLSDLLDFICEETIQLFGLTAAFVGQHQGSHLVIKAGAGLDIVDWSQHRLDAAEAVCLGDFLPADQNTSQYRRTQKSVIDKFTGSELCISMQRHNVRSALYIHLVVKGKPYGRFCLFGNRVNTFDDNQLEKHLYHLGKRISIAVEMVLNQQQLRLLSAALSAAGDGIFITDCNGLIEWVNVAFCQQTGYSREEISAKTPRVLKSGQYDTAYYTALWDTISSGHIWSRETIERNKAGIEYIVHQTITPIKDHDGNITHYVAIHKDITALKEHEQRIAFMAHHDALTHLPNRLLFYDRLSQAILNAHRNRQNIALLYIDLDNFKPVNDQYGHDTGDILLQQVSQRLKLCVRESDTLSRLGGDEFAIILPNINHSDAAQLVSEKVIATLSEPFEVMQHIIHIGSSIGIAYYPEDAIDQENLVKQADKAMYQAKKQRNAYRLASATS